MLQPRRIILEGFVAGLIGAAAVAIWFLVVDAVNGRPFYTPAMLGSAVFDGLRDPTLVQIEFRTVIMYSMIHVLAFLGVGTVAALLVAEAEEVPHMVWLLVVFFAVFEFGFYIVVATTLTPLLRALAWVNVAIGNLIAAVGMGYYLWRAHPKLREELQAHPLGSTGDHEVVTIPPET
jgi:hypothetical protein